MADILVDPDYSDTPAVTQPEPRADLATWVMARVEQWRNVRDSAYKAKWDSYYRAWRGRYDDDSRARRTERSKIVAPASQIAVDLMFSEMVEAVLGRETFIDIGDDVLDTERDDAIAVRDMLLEDLRKDGIAQAVSEIILNGALYGTLAAKIVTDVREEARPVVKQAIDEETGQPVMRMEKQVTKVVRIFPEPIEPGQLVVDPGASRIDDMLGTAHECRVPLHKIRRRQTSGTYYGDVTVSGGGSTLNATDERKEELNGSDEGCTVDITEWHGLVPKKLLMAVRGAGDKTAEALAKSVPHGEMVEAIVTIANGSTLLRAIPNFAVMEDRAIVAEQFDDVPNRFWGRGVVEKGFNIQKALDAELRHRADSLAWLNNPMMAGDITRLPPKMDLNVWPGKFFQVKGNPSEVLQPLRFGDVNASSFQQAQDLERMLQQATGAVDPSVLNAGVRDQATGASAVNVSGIVKRSKRTMLNLESFLTTLIQRIVWRKMQFEPEKYPQDYNFVVRGTIGVMARELENQQLGQLIQFTEQGSAEQIGVLKLLIESGSSAHKKELLQLLEQRLQGMQPSEEQQQEMKEAKQLERLLAQERLRNLQANTAKQLADAGSKEADAMLKKIEADLKDDMILLEHMREVREQQEVRAQNRQIDQTERKLDLEERRMDQDLLRR